MKKIILLMTMVLSIAAASFSQAPGILNYQGVARNSVGNVLVNQNITLRLTIHNNTAAGPVVYQESRAVTTNPFGLFNVQVGSPGAISVTGTVAGVNWAVGDKYIQVEIDPNGGSSFINIGTAQLASVPYSLFSALSGDLVLPFNKTQADAGTLFRITNSGTGSGSTALEGLTNSTAGSANGIIGTVTSTTPGGFSAGVRGINNGTGGLGIGVYGSQAGSGWGVYGISPSGLGVFGSSSTGTGVNGFSTSSTGVYGNSTTGNAGLFEVSNTASTADALRATTAGTGASWAIRGISSGTNGAGLFQQTNATNTSNNLQSNQAGLGRAGLFNATNAASTANAVDINVAGTGFGLRVSSTNGTPRAIQTVGGLQFTGISEANNRILSSDALGNALWKDPSAVGLVTGSGTLNFIPKWTPNGTTLGNSLIFDDGTFVGVGTSTPTSNKLHVLQTGGAPNSAATFQINNAASTSAVANVTTNGIGGGLTVQLTNASNGARGVDVLQTGVGPGVFATSAGGNAVWGITSSISAAGVIGDNTFGEAVVGRNRGGNGVGAVVGRNDSTGYGVRGFNTKDGIGVLGQTGISGGAGTAGRFENVNAANTNPTVVVATNGIGGGIRVDMPNASNGARGIDVNQAGVGPGVFSVSTGGNAVWGITSSISAAGVIGDNTFGEAVVGRNRGGNGVGAVVGRNDSTGYGVRGFNTKDGIGVLGQTGISGGTGVGGRFENVNAANSNVALIASTNGGGAAFLANNTNGGATDIAIFQKSSSNVARIDGTGRGFFNNGTQVGGADVAEAFEVEGFRNEYEAGDVLVISQTSDRKVEKSSTPYSTLVSGVYATKPGVILTEKNAEADQLDDMVPMGVIGVIPTKVCLEGGTIKRGDLLVTSSIPGVAMKADPDKVKVGQVLGKALQDYNENAIGKINVLVSVK